MIYTVGEMAQMFISLVRQYTRAKKLTPRMLNELVEKIEVFNAEKVNGVWEQRLRIHYNCVGTIEIPSALPLPTPDVSVNTRKGVVVNYAPCDVAIQQIKNDECSLTAKCCKNIRHGADKRT